MEESPKVHQRHYHRKSKHSRNSSRRNNNDESTVSLNDDKSVPVDTLRSAKETDGGTSNEPIHPNGEPKIILDDCGAEDVDEIQSHGDQKGLPANIGRDGRLLRRPQPFSDPMASPAQRSTRSRNSVEKSPRQKRSKSESRRRRERKLIAAGELEVRQANETLMRYLKQCSEINDASLSGELEIDESIDDRRVNRKTKSQRERRGNQSVGTNRNIIGDGCVGGDTTNFIRDQMPPVEFGSILHALNTELVPEHGEIYNPFTPVVSPTEGPPLRSNKMFIQTSRGFRPVNDNSFFKTSMHDDPESNK